MLNKRQRDLPSSGLLPPNHSKQSWAHWKHGYRVSILISLTFPVLWDVISCIWAEGWIINRVVSIWTSTHYGILVSPTGSLANCTTTLVSAFNFQSSHKGVCKCFKLFQNPKFQKYLCKSFCKLEWQYYLRINLNFKSTSCVSLGYCKSFCKGRYLRIYILHICNMDGIIGKKIVFWKFP